ncbi:MAG TPA: hypothetical protein H9842_06415 [Candidatus Agathobaculum merdipullorum]|nr:hypothetical protein [Candidatus Agathobaculum merdipullorum]
MEIIIKATSEEVAALVVALQGRQEIIADQVAKNITACLDRAMRDIS